MISVIIPVYNEEKEISTLIQTVENRDEEALISEIIVVDGGSADQTVNLATEAGAIVLKSPRKGRSSQMNFGAGHATQSLLYFLHADSHPPPRFTSKIKDKIDQGFGAGCFRLQFDQNHPLLNFYSWFTRFDMQAFRFGDQSLFIQQDLFNKIGKFREDLIVMEDNEIVKRIKKRAHFCIMEDSVTTSARKYRDNGYIKLQAVFTFIYIGYHLGIDQKKLVSFYKRWIRF